MSGFGSLLAMSGLLGLGSFFVAQLPLSFAFSNSATVSLSNLGTGLLIGAALGVVLPEGVEVIMSGKTVVPVTWIALSLLTGFSFMIVVEHISGSDHSHAHSKLYNIFDLGAIAESSGSTERNEDTIEQAESSRHSDMGSKKALKLTLGLSVHSLADGFALGASALSESAPETGKGHSELSLIIFLVLLVHKAPAALALTTSLLMTPLSRSAIRRHIAIFAASTPAGAILTYFILDLLGTRSGSEWTGQTLLFSAGTFLYVATVLQSVTSHDSANSQAPKNAKGLLIVLCGMLLPLGISLMVEHDHGAPPGGDLPGGIQISP